MEKIGVLFPNHIEQYKGMGKLLYDCYDSVQEIFKDANESLGFEISNYIFYDYQKEKVSLELSCPSIVIASAALYHIFNTTYDVKPQVFIGDGIGEISALMCAEVIQFKDAVKLAFAIGEIFKHYGYDQVGNHIEEIHQEKMKKEIMELGHNIKIDFNQNISKVVCSADALEYQQNTFWETFADRILEQRDYEKVKQLIEVEQVEYLIDIGPSCNFGKMLESKMPTIRICWLDEPGDAYHAQAIFQTKKLFNYRYLLGKMLAVAVSIQNCNFDDEEYENGVVIPYKKLKEIHDKYQLLEKEVTSGDIAQATNLLIQILRTKGLSQEEILRRVRKLESEVFISLT